MISDEIDKIINKAIEEFDDSHFLESPFEKLISFSELVDRLSIVNFKLYRLKDKVIDKTLADDECIRAAIEDVRLCEERSRLKRCINDKLIAIIKRAMENDETADPNPEVKDYG